MDRVTRVSGWRATVSVTNASAAGRQAIVPLSRICPGHSPRLAGIDQEHAHMLAMVEGISATYTGTSADNA